MYKALTPQWAGTLLGLVQVVCIPIPFVFYKWGEKIRAKSPLIRQMRADQERREEKMAAAQRKKERKNEERGDGVPREKDEEKEEKEVAVKSAVSVGEKE